MLGDAEDAPRGRRQPGQSARVLFGLGRRPYGLFQRAGCALPARIALRGHSMLRSATAPKIVVSASSESLRPPIR
eukprot:SAG22_NODE_121_length_19129_cov_36.644614_8_plen_75_part_00